MSTKKLQILGSFGNKVYTQPDEPADAVDGSVWIDLDETAAGDYGDADTLDGKHASDFVLATDMVAVHSDISELQTKVGDIAVTEQINQALAGFSSGKTLTEHLAEEQIILTSLQYGDTLPDVGTPGRIFFKKVT